MANVIEDTSHHGPISYIQGIGLQPEDCYGFLPVNHEDVTPYFYLYRDRPEYAQARTELRPPQATLEHFGPLHLDSAQQSELDMDRDLIGGSDGGLADIIRSAQEMQRSWTGTGLPGAPPDTGSPVPPPASPDPSQLERIANLLDAGAINEQEYMKLLGEATTAAPAPATESAPEEVAGGCITASRSRRSMAR